MKMKRALLLVFLCVASRAVAQQFGGNPPSVKWEQINTPQAKVIFPRGLDSTAQVVAAVIKNIAPFVEPTIGVRQKQISIVLQDQTTTSNAYVGLAPFRSEFYLMPSQNSFELGSLDWPTQLAIHEYRHVQQYNNFNVGLSHLLKILFGEGGQALGNDLSIPNWFFEGDAVYNETLVSRQGRGRLPYFYNGFRALWAAGKDYSWMKLRNGSYVDYIPDHYPLGYMMVAYGREKYGADFWRKVTHDAAAYKTGLYPFQSAIKKYAGVKYDTFRYSAFRYFRDGYDLIPSDGPDPLLTKRTNKGHFDANRQYPAFVNDSTLLYLKTSYKEVPRFILNVRGKEWSIAVQSINDDDYFTYNKGKVIYSAYGRDPRWGYRTYAELVVLDINTGKERRITRHTRYFAPAFNADNSKLIAVDISTSGKSMLHQLDPATGKLLAIVPDPAGLFYTYPKFYNDKQVISAVRNKRGQMSLALIDLHTGAAKYLLPFSYRPIGFTAVDGDTVYFTATSNNNDNLCRLNIRTGKLSLIISGSTLQKDEVGAYQATVSANNVAWVAFSADGYRIHQNDKKTGQEIPYIPGGLADLELGGLENDSTANVLAKTSSTALPVTPYSKAHNLFNFHSLFPTINDPNYSIALVGENVLNTFQSELSLAYNRDEGYKRAGYTATYGGLYPFISAGANYTLDRKGFYKGNNVFYNETDVHAGLQVPLNFTAGRTYTSLSGGSSIYYSQSRFQEAYRALLADRHYTYLSSFINFSNQGQKAKQNINPRIAQSVQLKYRNAIGGLSATQFLASGALYLPGIGLNHSLVVSGAHQHSGKNNGIGFSNDFPFSKGYAAQNLDNMNKLAVSYHFPIAYPDAGFGNIYYLLRLRGYVFYDHTHATDNGFRINEEPFDANFRSAGAALFFDGKLFNQGAVSFGIRYSYLLDRDLFGTSGKNRIELVLPVSIF